MIDRAIVILVFSLVISFISSEAWAQVPTFEFDQGSYVHEHSGYLTIEDLDETSNSIDALIEAVRNNDVVVNLYKIGDSQIYKSNFIQFSKDNDNVHGEFPVVQLKNLNSIVATYKGDTASATIDATIASLTLGEDYFSDLDDITRENYPDCRFFGDPDGEDDLDYICTNWETRPYEVNLLQSSSNYTLPTCDPLKDYNIDKLGVEVCPNTQDKDIYIEIDYMTSHYPNVEALEKVVEAFLDAPDPIQLHIFIDEEIKHVDTIDFDETVEGDFYHIKAKEFGFANEKDANGNWTNADDEQGKAQIFYYYLWAHSQEAYPGASGRSELSGNDGAVTLGQFPGMVGNLDQQAGTFMHELGHNIGLNHGGNWDNDVNCKPNLLSVMTYSRQFSTLLDRPLDYSREPVGKSSNLSSTTLGMEDQLVDADGIQGYLNCPDDNSNSSFVITSDGIDQDFDGIADICDPQTIISSNLTVKNDVSLFGNLTINDDAVLTIEPGVNINFDVQNHNVTIKSGGGLLVRYTGNLIGFIPIDGDVNQVNDHLENSPIVFGDVNFAHRIENSRQDSITWSSDRTDPEWWKYIRHIKDTQGNWVCPVVLPETWDTLRAKPLDSVNQWELIDLSRANDYWTGGRLVGGDNNRHVTGVSSADNPRIQQISLTDSLGIKEFTESGDAKLNNEENQVAICHIHDGNPDDRRTLWVEPSVVESHLSHGDSEGMCKGDSENIKIIVKSGAGDEKLHKNILCKDCFSPSIVEIDVGTTVNWINDDGTESHSITSVFSDYIWNTSHSDTERKFDYKTGEFNNNYFMKGQTFSHTFEKEGIYQYGCIYHPWMKGTIAVGTEIPPTDDPECKGIEFPDPLRFNLNGNWCISMAEAKKQASCNPNLDIKSAPICSNLSTSEPEAITIENVRAAHSVNVDKVLSIINKLNKTTDFENPEDKADLISQLEKIRNYILTGQMREAYEGYNSFSSSVNVTVSSETGKYQILKAADRNKQLTSNDIPEFETVSILVLVLSTISIIAVSRKISFSSINSSSI